MKSYVRPFKVRRMKLPIINSRYGIRAGAKMSPNQPTSLGAAAVRPLRPQGQLSWQPLTNLAILLLGVGVIGFVAALRANRWDRGGHTWLGNLLFIIRFAQAGGV